ncbi:MAG: hypothetical protein CMG64_00675 [Candidatus Marinimicrobia bacterium]|nr:hypothetical protein [Candidatus Neomarinimicrobiota bacterium]|tara:strand:- start:8645 stop:9208 length:564 start_codon:yes stop_codon:yes gene_type:complete
MKFNQYIDSSSFNSKEYVVVSDRLNQDYNYPDNIEIDIPNFLQSKSSINFNVLPNKSVKEDIVIKKYILKHRFIEAVFDREYFSEMEQSPDHLIFLSVLVQLQKMIYVYLCYEFGISMKLNQNEKIKIWPTNININMPKMVTKTKNISQEIKIKNLRKTGDKTYFGKCESSVDGIITLTADALIYII